MALLLGSIAGVSSLFVGGTVLYKVLRPRYSMRVTCWFCNSKTVVPYGNQNCWDCPQCDQYNGFGEDGDYNKPIPAQFSEDLNHPVSRLNRPTVNLQRDSGLLCDDCNRNQLLKVKQLANFVPYNEATFDMEVDAYQHHLEQVYRLCDRCRLQVQQELERQHQHLHLPELVEEHYRMKGNQEEQPDESLNQSSIPDFTTPPHIRVLRLASALFAFIITMASLLMLLRGSDLQLDPDAYITKGLQKVLESVFLHSCTVIFIGMFTELAAVFLHGTESVHTIDALACFSWLLLLLLEANLPFMSINDRLLAQVLVAFSASILTMVCLVCKRRSKTPTVRIITRRRPAWQNDSSLCSSVDNSPAPSLREDRQSVRLRYSETAPSVHSSRLSFNESPSKTNERKCSKNIRYYENSNQERVPKRNNISQENKQEEHNLNQTRKRTTTRNDFSSESDDDAETEHTYRMKTMRIGTPPRSIRKSNLPKAFTYPIKSHNTSSDSGIGHMDKQRLIHPPRFSPANDLFQSKHFGQGDNGIHKKQFGHFFRSASPSFNSFNPRFTNTTKFNTQDNAMETMEDDRVSLFSVHRSQAAISSDEESSTGDESCSIDSSSRIAKQYNNTNLTSHKKDNKGLHKNRDTFERNCSSQQDVRQNTFEADYEENQDGGENEEQTSSRRHKKRKSNTASYSITSSILFWLSLFINLSIGVYLMSGTHMWKETLRNINNFSKEGT